MTVEQFNQAHSYIESLKKLRRKIFKLTNNLSDVRDIKVRFCTNGHEIEVQAFPVVLEILQKELNLQVESLILRLYDLGVKVDPNEFS